MIRARLSIPFLLDLLSLAVRKEASAIYVVPWMPPTMRLDERVVSLSATSFTPEQTAALVRDVLDDEQRIALDKSRQIQFSFVREGLGRFRVHAFRRHGQPAMAIRPYALPVPTLQSLALPPPLHTLALADRGLVLLASRSPSLRGDGVAAMVDHRNRFGRGAILLLEDASRYWHDAELCAVEQGIGSGLAEERAQARHLQPGAAPLAIAWGEARDPPALARAVRAAASSLCFVTLQADNVIEALQSVAALSELQGDVNAITRLAMAMEAVIALQRLAPREPAAEASSIATPDHGPALAELLLNSPEVAANLAEHDFAALRAVMKTSRGRGALTRDDHLLQLVAQGALGYEEALRHAGDAAEFARRWQLGPQTAVPAWVHPRAAPPNQPVPPAAVAAALDFDVDRQNPEHPFSTVLPPGADTTFDSVEWPRTDHPADPLLGGGLTPRPPSAAPAPGTAGGVLFRAFAPGALVPGTRSLIDLWACLPAQQAEVLKLATAGDAQRLAGLRAEATLARGTVVTAQLRVDGLHLAEPTQWLAWQGEPTLVSFVVEVAAGLPSATHAARVRLAVNGLPIGELSFLLRVASEGDPRPEDSHAARRMLRNAFASYASEDRDEVLARVQAMKTLAPEVDVFVDTSSLHAGERWRERIERELGRRERLFLFWSPHASQSPWVDFEWRLALRTRGLDAIDPVPLADTQVAPPPPELAELRFADLYTMQLAAAGRQEQTAGA